MTDTPEAAQAPAEAEVSVDEALSQVWQDHNPEPKDEDATPTPEADGEAVSVQPVEEPAAEVVDLPTDLPVELKDDWGSLPEKTRDAIATSHRELSKKLGDQGRTITEMTPVMQVLQDATQSMPFLSDMHPAQAASQILETAKIAQRFNDDPVTATLQVIQRYGVADQVAQVLGGQVAQPQINPQKIADMTRQQIEYAMTERDVTHSVQDFSGNAEYWDKVAEDLPDYIGIVSKKNPEAAPAEKLSAAYDMAVRANGLKASSETASPEDVATVDPEQAEAAARAKSVNVASKPTGAARKLSEDELLRKTFRKMQAS